ncbi:helix-turn-helix domain-containing protein [Clostridium sulfidigenes]|uniref:helix-turn-helix domain-containing protein n=1 Tax=Clostridium sulfidigenes TaxID=318464 RepID=UPI003F8ABC57
MKEFTNNNLNIFLEQNIFNNDFSKFLYEVEDMEFQLIENLVRERKRRSITQKEIAERTGLSQQAVSRIEKYGNKPSLNNLLKYMYAIGININDLFGKKLN